MYLLKRHAHTIYEIHHAFLVSLASPQPAHLGGYHYKAEVDLPYVRLPRDWQQIDLHPSFACTLSWNRLQEYRG
jgi:hypothetical protein